MTGKNASSSASRNELKLDRVVLLGRTLEEYRRYFALDLPGLEGKSILDLAAGVSSFCAEGRAHGLEVMAADLIYDFSPSQIRTRCEPDLDFVIDQIAGLTIYKWEFYKNPERLRSFREKAYKTFLADFENHPERYVVAKLPRTPFRDGQFDLTLVSYLLFVYDDQRDYAFHKESILEIMRITSGEARIYPLVNFRAERSKYLDALRCDPEMSHLEFLEVKTDFEFLTDSNWYLRVRRRATEPTAK
jgi:SAM-dependent methyltransferase